MRNRCQTHLGGGGGQPWEMAKLQHLTSTTNEGRSEGFAWLTFAGGGWLGAGGGRRLVSRSRLPPLLQHHL